MNEHNVIGGVHYCTLTSLVDGVPPENSAYGILDLYTGGRVHLNGFRLLASRDLAIRKL